MIKIEHTIHGYQNGHQLLMSSAQLSNEAKMTLLVQSDLSGSNIDEGFKSYLTGYPMQSHYAFSKTWYAEEMRRPGCVWTHTLLISFADLGKIPDLNYLQTFFKRPKKDDYEEYSHSILIEREDLPNNLESAKLLDFALLNSIYTTDDKTVLVSAIDSSEFERATIELWSYQWPRLRRNFLFCTGALSLKILDGREFDLQIVPKRNLGMIEKQSRNAIIADNGKTEDFSWLRAILESNKNELRKFLWAYGSDVKGVRKNYIPLLNLYLMSQKRNVEFHEIYEILYSSFESGDGLRLKEDFFGNNKVFDYSDIQLLNYLILDPDLKFEVKSDFVTDLLINAFFTKKISLSDVLKLYFNSTQNRLSKDIFQRLDLNFEDMLECINIDSRSIEIFKSRIILEALMPETWQKPYDVQLSLLRIIESIKEIDWEAILYVTYRANSEIIIRIIEKNSYIGIYTLLKILNADKTGIDSKYVSVIARNKRAFQDFVLNSTAQISAQISTLLFKLFTYTEIEKLPLGSSQWIAIYRQIKDEETRVTSSCYLLTVGFNRRVKNPGLLIASVFPDVYYFAKRNRISSKLWNLIPVDTVEEDDEYDPIFSFLSYFNLVTSKKNRYKKTDSFSLLIPTLVNKFMKNVWQHQYFLDCLATEDSTKHAFIYCIGFRRGDKFLKVIKREIMQRKLIAEKHHLIVFDFLKY